MEKIWTWDSLITKYIAEKVRRGYDVSCTFEEIVDFLDIITYFVQVKDSNVSYGEALKNYINGVGSKKKEWSIGKKDFEYIPIVEQTESGLIVPTYQLISSLPGYRDFASDEEKAYDEKFSSYLKHYMRKNCFKRKIDTSKSLDEDTVRFGEKAASALLLQIWKNRLGRYQDDGKWPIQCSDIKKYLLDTDLSSIINLPPMRNELIDFYFIVSKRIMFMAQNDSNFRMTNYADEVLAKSNYDLIMDGYFDFFHPQTPNRNQEGIILDRSQEEFQTVLNWYKGRIEKEKLDNPKVLTLVRDIKQIKQR